MTIHYPLHWIHSQNFGDALNPHLYEAITGRKPTTPYGKEPKIVACGSLAHEAKPGDLVWGTGAMSPDLPLQCDESTQVFAVRGPLTSALFRGRGKTVPEIYGDPALLLPLFFSPAKEKKQRVGIIPHYVDEEFVRTLYFDDDMIISPMTPFEQFIQRVTSCEIIISSALHGIIIAEAYNIPAVWVEFSDNVAGHGFKFRDYYLGTNREPSKGARWHFLRDPYQTNKLMFLSQIERLADDWQHPIFSPTKLLNACPFNWTTTDYVRWQDPQEWRSRLSIIGSLIAQGSFVIDFGCGTTALRSFLPNGCTYIPSDIMKRSPDTLICDLNAAIFPTFIPKSDVAVFSGVLEYIHDLRRLTRWLPNIANTVIVSYASHGNADERASNGWVNSYTLAELVELFASAGYVCVHDEVWQSQTVFKFVKV